MSMERQKILLNLNVKKSAQMLASIDTNNDGLDLDEFRRFIRVQLLGTRELDEFNAIDEAVLQQWHKLLDQEGAGRIRKAVLFAFALRQATITLGTRDVTSMLRSFPELRGRITLEGVESFVKHLGYDNLTAADIMSVMDMDGSGEVTLGEFDLWAKKTIKVLEVKTIDGKKPLSRLAIMLDNARVRQQRKLERQHMERKATYQRLVTDNEQVVQVKRALGNTLTTEEDVLGAKKLGLALKRKIAQMLDTSEYESAVDILEVWDSNGNGSLSLKEFHETLVLLGIECEAGPIQLLFDDIDYDGDYQVQLCELAEYITGAQTRRSRHGHDEAASEEDTMGNALPDVGVGISNDPAGDEQSPVLMVTAEVAEAAEAIEPSVSDPPTAEVGADKSEEQTDKAGPTVEDQSPQMDANSAGEPAEAGEEPLLVILSADTQAAVKIVDEPKAAEQATAEDATPAEKEAATVEEESSKAEEVAMEDAVIAEKMAEEETAEEETAVKEKPLEETPLKEAAQLEAAAEETAAAANAAVVKAAEEAAASKAAEETAAAEAEAAEEKPVVKAAEEAAAAEAAVAEQAAEAAAAKVADEEAAAAKMADEEAAAVKAAEEAAVAKAAEEAAVAEAAEEETAAIAAEEAAQAKAAEEEAAVAKIAEEAKATEEPSATKATEEAATAAAEASAAEPAAEEAQGEPEATADEAQGETNKASASEDDVVGTGEEDFDTGMRQNAMEREAADADNDGKLDFAEFCVFVRDREEGEFTDKELKERFAALDEDGSGKVDMHEYLQWSLKDALMRSSSRVMDLFRAWDEDHSGSVDKKEFAKAVRSLGFHVSQEDANAVFDSLDDDKSGALEYRELNEMLRKGLAANASKANLKRMAGKQKETGRNAKVTAKNMNQNYSVARTAALPPMVKLDASSGQSIQEQIYNILNEHQVKLIDLFREWDDDGNGALDKKEMRQAIAALGYDAPKKEIDKFFGSIDADGNGWIEFGELKAALKEKAVKQATAELQKKKKKEEAETAKKPMQTEEPEVSAEGADEELRADKDLFEAVAAANTEEEAQAEEAAAAATRELAEAEAELAAAAAAIAAEEHDAEEEAATTAEELEEAEAELAAALTAQAQVGEGVTTEAQQVS